MAHPKTVHCKRCSRHVREAGPLSARKICVTCAEAAMASQYVQLRAKSGPAFDRWAEGLLNYVANLNARGCSSTDAALDAILADADPAIDPARLT